MFKRILGIIASIVCLLFITVGDAVDELILDVDTKMGGVMAAVCGAFIMYCYIKYSRENKTGFLYFVLYQVEYWISLIIFVFGIMFLESVNLWIPQKNRNVSFASFNGVEYMYYGALVGFFMLILGAVYHILLMVKNRKEISK